MVDRNESKDDCEAGDESDTERGNGINTSEIPEHRVASATPNVPGSIHTARRSMKQAEHGLMSVSAMETRRITGNKKK